jgi:hypothetical protein
MNLKTDIVQIDFGKGAYGKTLLVKAPSISALTRIGDIFNDLGSGKLSHCQFFPDSKSTATRVGKVDFWCLPQDTIEQGEVKCVSESELEWWQKPADWILAHDMVQGLMDRGSGHQYLTQEGVDKVVVLLSYNET